MFPTVFLVEEVFDAFVPGIVAFELERRVRTRDMSGGMIVDEGIGVCCWLLDDEDEEEEDEE